MRKFIYITFIGCLLQSGYAAGFWERAGELPIPVYGAQAIVHDSLIYIIGGYSDIQESALDTIQIYDPVHNKWKESPYGLFVGRYGLNAHVYHDSLYVFGGVFDGSVVTLGLEKWGFATNPVIHSYDFNFNRFFATSEIHNDYLYIFGGFPNYDWAVDERFMQYLAKYHLSSATVVDSLNINRTFSDYLPSRQMSALIGNNIYLIGGEYNGILDDIERYDLEMDTIIPVAKLQRERSSGAAIALNSDLIIIIGGIDGENRILRDTEIYNVTENFIYSGPSLLKSRSEIAAVLYEDTVYVFGGKDNDGKGISFVEKISLDKITYYTNIPTVKEEGAEKSRTATSIMLHNVPNPFNSATTIHYQLSMTGQVEVSIYNLLGQKVVTLVSQRQESGDYKVQWDGTGEQHQPIPSGFYFCRLTTGTQSITHKLVLLK